MRPLFPKIVYPFYSTSKPVGTTIGNKGFYRKIRGKTRNGVKCIVNRQAEETKKQQIVSPFVFWRSFAALCVKSRPDAVNCHQEKTSLRLTIRIDDSDNPSYNDRYNNTVTLNPGANHISIPLNSLVTSGASRKLNLLSIEKVILFLVQPKERRTLYLDNLRLE